MGVRFFLLFVTFFIVSSIYLFYQKAMTLNIISDTKSLPLMMLNDSKIYDITFEGISSYIQSKKAKKYKDRYELYGLFSTKKDKNDIQKLWADKGVLKDDILNLKGNVLYEDSDKQMLKSDTVIYNLKKDILSSDRHFEARYKNSKIVGSSFVYHKRDKRLIADNIKANIVMEE